VQRPWIIFCMYCHHFISGCLIDDIVIARNMIDNHILHLIMILLQLKEANFTISLTISEFLMHSMTVSRYCLEDGYIKPSQKYIEAVLSMSPQCTKTGVQVFLGLWIITAIWRQTSQKLPTHRATNEKSTPLENKMGTETQFSKLSKPI
jgi:hypothetical protein